MFEIIDESTLPVGPNDGGGQDDGSQYLNDSGQGMEEEEQLQEPDVEADKSSDGQALVKAVEPTASTSSTKKTKRGPAQERSSKERLIIEKVYRSGEPAWPISTATKFTSQCGVIVRDLIPISTEEWHEPAKEDDHPAASFVSERSKTALFVKLMEHFTLPECDTEETEKEMRAAVKHWALKKMAEAFNAYKKRLWKEYRKKKTIPKFEGPLEKQKKHWPAFLAYKQSAKGQKRSEKNAANAAKKKYHHTMGSGGYRVAVPKFDKLEEDLRLKGIIPGTHDFPKRSRNWLLGHGATFDAEGNLIMSEKIKAPFAALEKVFKEVKAGEFRPDRDNDELTLALGNPEHGGWTRGKGRFPWCFGFKKEDCVFPYRSRERGKRRKEAQVEERVGCLEALVMLQQQQINELTSRRSQEQDPSFDETDPSKRRSSVASTEVLAGDATVIDTTHMIDDAAAQTEAVDAIKEKTSCELYVSISNVSIKVADGYALPCVEGATCHGRPITPGYARVGVDDVQAAWRIMRLDIPGGDGVETLGEAVHSIIQWKKEGIVFPMSSPPPPPPPTSPRRSPPPAQPPTTSPARSSPAHVDAMDVSSSSPARSPMPQPTPPPTKSSKRKAGTSKSSPKKKPAPKKKPKPPPEKLPYEMTNEETIAWVAADTKRQMSGWGKKPSEPPKEPIDPKVQEHFMDLLEMPSQVQLNLPSNYARGLLKTYSAAKKTGRTIPQLGEQPNQSAPPLKVLPTAQTPSGPVDMEAAIRFARECGVTLEHLLSGRDGNYTNADTAWPYELGKSLIRPDQLDSLTTFKRQLHTWYVQATKKKLDQLMVKVKHEHFFRDDSLCIDFEDLYFFYNLDGLDKSIISTYCL